MEVSEWLSSPSRIFGMCLKTTGSSTDLQILHCYDWFNILQDQIRVWRPHYSSLLNIYIILQRYSKHRRLSVVWYLTLMFNTFSPQINSLVRSCFLPWWCCVVLMVQSLFFSRYFYRLNQIRLDYNILSWKGHTKIIKSNSCPWNIVQGSWYIWLVSFNDPGSFSLHTTQS